MSGTPDESDKKKKHDYLFKLLVVGDGGVGKTCILLRYTEDGFKMNHILTIGIDYKTKNILIDNKAVKLQIWDTAGQERFKTITKTYYKGSHGIILTYGVDDPESFQNCQNWLKEIDKNAQPSVTKVLVGNKCDCGDKRAVSYEEGEKLAKEYKLPFFETSAKENVNINELFDFVAKEVMKSFENKGFDKKADDGKKKAVVLNTINEGKKDSKCC